MNDCKWIVQLAPATPGLGGALVGSIAGRETYPGDAGIDLANLRPPFLIEAGQIGARIPLGVKVRVRKRQKDGRYEDWPWSLVMRSSTAYQTPMRLANSIGIMDAGFRGEVLALVDNYCDYTYILKTGEARFQLILPGLPPVEAPHVKIVMMREFSGGVRKPPCVICEVNCGHG